MMRFERFERRSYVLGPPLITIMPSDGATVRHSVDFTRSKHCCSKNSIVVKLEKNAGQDAAEANASPYVASY